MVLSASGARLAPTEAERRPEACSGVALSASGTRLAPTEVERRQRTAFLPYFSRQYKIRKLKKSIRCHFPSDLLQSNLLHAKVYYIQKETRS